MRVEENKGYGTVYVVNNGHDTVSGLFVAAKSNGRIRKKRSLGPDPRLH